MSSLLRVFVVAALLGAALPASAEGALALGPAGWECAPADDPQRLPDAAAWRPCATPSASGATSVWTRTRLPTFAWPTAAYAPGWNQSIRYASVGGTGLLDKRGTLDVVDPLYPLPSGSSGAELVVLLQAAPGAPMQFAAGRVGDAASLRLGLLRDLIPLVVIAGLLAFVGLVGLGLALVWPTARLTGAAFATYAFATTATVLGISTAPQLLLGGVDFWLSVSLAASSVLGPATMWLCAEAVLTQEARWYRLLRRTLWAGGGALAVLALVSRSTAIVFLPLSSLGVVAGMGSAAAAAFVAARRGSGDARMFLGGLVVTLALTTIDGVRIVLDDATTFVSPWGFPAIVASCALVVLLRTNRQQAALAERGEAVRAEEAAESVLARELEASAADLLVVVDRLHAAVRAQEEQLSRQAAALQETHATAEEIRVTSGAAAEKARGLLETARLAADAGEEGERALERTMSGLESVAGTVGQMASRVSDVEALSREMAEVAGTVRALADRTNLLALNASLEASRSGSMGRGFSVVAREVRRLADESMTSADRIRTMLERVIAGARASAEASARSRAGVAAGAAEVRTSSDELRAVATLIRETNANVRQIAAAVSQQHAGVSEVFGAVDALTRQAREALVLVGETRAVAESIAGIARTMVEGSAMDAAFVAMTDGESKRVA